MTLTPDQAREQANELLAALYANVTDWDEGLLDQAVLAIAGDGRPFSANDLIAVIPELGRSVAGLYFAGLIRRRSPQIVIRIGDEPSVNEKAHGKPVNVYALTTPGKRFLQDRQAARLEQRKQAA
jgi:hypothetical protein